MTEPAAPTLITEPPKETIPTESVPAETKEQPEQKQEVKTEVTSAVKFSDLKIPDGFSLDEKAAEGFLGVVNDEKLSSSERINKLIGLHVEAMKQASEKSSADVASMLEKWREETMADPEIGGDKLSGNLTNISKALDRFGSPEAKMAFNFTGAGNNPHIIKFIAKMAAALNEPKPGIPGSPGAGADKSIADLLYPTQGKN